MRNQTQKVIDRAGIRIGVVLTDIFGTNGRRILDGLVNRLHPTDILASLSAHVRRKLDQLGDALRLTLRETEHLLLADLLREHDAVSRRVHDFDRHLDQALALRDPLILQYEPNKKQVLSEDRTYRILKFAE